MFKTLIAKFSFFFWLIFLLLNIFTYLFITTSFEKILNQSEADKIKLILNTLKPAMAYDISFNQEKQFEQLLKTILQANGVESIQVRYADKHSITKQKETHAKSKKLFSYTTNIIDPFTHKKIATITIHYSNAYIQTLQQQILTLQLYIFLLTLFLFSMFYVYVKQDLNALRTIAHILRMYSQSKKRKVIRFRNRSQEIQTIANVANTMMGEIEQHLQELKTFNEKLKDDIKEEVQKVQKQEQLMLHQSRQAAMGEILESIAHQWRQPLNIIGISVSNLEMEAMLGKVDDNNLREKLALIAANTNYMSDTIDDFRNFLNPQGKKELFNPKESIEDILKILKDELKAHHIHIKLIEKTPLLFEGIENEFKQLLLILLNNAKDALHSKITDKSISFGEIFIVISKNEKEGIIAVEDNGGGIPEDIISSIFEPYFSTKPASHGTGIGLYIAKNIVDKKLCGTLLVHNTKRGCCFSIKIPLQGEKQ
ncbi:MAG: hypothetical protein FAF04_01720 [Epsilonproteobacteria bacterium]|nr:hypothetical protein [Campylobacterota bacterium]